MTSWCFVVYDHDVIGVVRVHLLKYDFSSLFLLLSVCDSTLLFLAAQFVFQ